MHRTVQIIVFSTISCLLVYLILLTDVVWLKVRRMYLLATPEVLCFVSRVGLQGEVMF